MLKSLPSSPLTSLRPVAASEHAPHVAADRCLFPGPADLDRDGAAAAVFLENRIHDFQQQTLDAADGLRHLRVHQQLPFEAQRLRLQRELTLELNPRAR